MANGAPPSFGVTSPPRAPMSQSTSLALIGRLLVTVAVCEYLIMTALGQVSGLSPTLEAVIDTAALTLILTVTLVPWIRRTEAARLLAEAVITQKNEALTLSVVQLQRLRQALDQHAIVAVTDPAGRIIEVNDAFCAISGYSRAELIGQTPRAINSGYHPPAFFADLWQTIKAGRIWHGEFRNRHKNGSFYWRDTTIVPFTDARGRIETYIAIGYDITARREENASLVRLAKEAQAASQAKADFLANMSHEIRTPMNAVIGMTELLLDTPLTATQREFVQTISISGDSLLVLINDILDFSKIESGKLELEHAPLNLRDCIESAIDLTVRPASVKGLDLVHWLEDDVPEHILGDITRLRQILVNLIGNAVKFTAHGEVLITVSHRPATDAQPARLHFAVRDTGIGILPDRMDRLFKAFSQVDTSTTRKYGGTGLGLTICTRLIDCMKGRIWVESAFGQGSTFQFELPLHPATAGTHITPVTPVPTLAGRRVLLVDDNPTNLQILTLQTQRWGLIPTGAASGVAALHQLETAPPFDLAIIDVQMPDMDGYQLAAEIRRTHPAHCLPIISLTSIGDDGKGFAALDVAQTLTKPAKAAVLFAALGKALGSHNAHPEHPAKPAPIPIDATLADRHPLRILLAEDNPTNQLVAQLLLERLGYTCTITSDGLEALAAVARQTFDIILMDMQMPEMDGLTCTRRLCAEQPESTRPWIIAMTANALEGDRELCLDAGMNDYLSKPISGKTLAQVLSRGAEQLPRRRNHRLEAAPT